LRYNFKVINLLTVDKNTVKEICENYKLEHDPKEEVKVEEFFKNKTMAA